MAIYTARQIVYGVIANIAGVILFLFGGLNWLRSTGLVIMFGSFGRCFHAVLTYVRYGMRKQLNINFDSFMQKHALVPKTSATTGTTTTALPDETPRTAAYG